MTPRPALRGRVAVVTGGGRGLGRAHALRLAGDGARVVVNDLGCDVDGTGRDPAVAAAVVAEIRGAGGEAVAHCGDVADWDEGRGLIDLAYAELGDLHVLVNNAGTLRDRMLVNLDADDFDAVVRSHLRGHFVPTRFAAERWRQRADRDDRVVVNTTSTAGLFGHAGQSSYAAAKAGIAALTLVGAEELARYGVRCNAIAPLARTRLTESVPSLRERMDREPGTWDPACAAAVVAALARATSKVAGRVILVAGETLKLVEPWSPGDDVSLAELGSGLPADPATR